MRVAVETGVNVASTEATAMIASVAVGSVVAVGANVATPVAI